MGGSFSTQSARFRISWVVLALAAPSANCGDSPHAHEPDASALGAGGGANTAGVGAGGSRSGDASAARDASQFDSKTDAGESWFFEWPGVAKSGDTCGLFEHASPATRQRFGPG